MVVDLVPVSKAVILKAAGSQVDFSWSQQFSLIVLDEVRAFTLLSNSKTQAQICINSLTVCLTKATSVSVVIIVCSYIVWGPVRDVKISLALQHLIFQTFFHVLFELRMKNMQFETNLP